MQHIEVTGSALLAPGELRALVAPHEGQALTLADLQDLADRITALYQHSGFPYARAYVPAQTLDDGRIRIAVLEARYDSVLLRNRSRVHDSVANVVLADLKIGAPVAQTSLDHTLLLLSDLPGTIVTGTLQPGRTSGMSELLVDMDAGPRAYGVVGMDDYGNAATGRARANGAASITNPLHQGDVLSVNALTAGRGLNYGRVGYALPVHGPETQVLAEASTLDYRVVYGNAVALLSHGTADVAGAGMRQVLVRSNATNIFGQLMLDETHLRDHIDSTQIRTDRHTDDLHGVLTVALTEPTGATSLNIAATLGRLRFDDPGAARVDAAGPRTSGRFAKFMLGASRLQPLTDTDSAYAVSGR